MVSYLLLYLLAFVASLLLIIAFRFSQYLLILPLVISLTQASLTILTTIQCHLQLLFEHYNQIFDIVCLQMLGCNNSKL